MKQAKQIDYSLMKEGESPRDFLQRLYTHALLNTYAASSVLEYVIYETHSMLMKEGRGCEDVDWVLNYYNSYKERICKTVNLPQDFMEDFFFKMQERNKAKLHRLLLETSMDCQRAGIEECNLLSHFAGITNMTQLVRLMWQASVQPAGMYGQMFGKYIKNAFFFLDLIDKRSVAAQDAMFPSLKDVSLKASSRMQDLLQEMVGAMLNGEMMEDAILYGYTENGITPKYK